MRKSSSDTYRVVFLTALVWAAALFIMPILLGLAIYGIERAGSFQLVPFFGGAFLNLFFGPAAGGAMAGYLMASVWRQFPTLPSIRVRSSVLIWGAVLFLTAIFLIYLPNLFQLLEPPQPLDDSLDPNVIPMPPLLKLLVTHAAFWLIPGTLGGLLFARQMQPQVGKIESRRIAWIAAGWGLGFALGGGMGIAVGSLVSWMVFSANDSAWLLNESLYWLGFGITGSIAGAAGAWVTLRGVRSADPISLAGSQENRLLE